MTPTITPKIPGILNVRPSERQYYRMPDIALSDLAQTATGAIPEPVPESVVTVDLPTAVWQEMLEVWHWHQESRTGRAPAVIADSWHLYWTMVQIAGTDQD